jgi:hypothetical protein
MNKLFLILALLGSVVGTSLTALGEEGYLDHDWNDGYWYHEHYGYWHGERGYWRYHHSQTWFHQSRPSTIEKEH